MEYAYIIQWDFLKAPQHPRKAIMKTTSPTAMNTPEILMIASTSKSVKSDTDTIAYTPIAIKTTPIMKKAALKTNRNIRRSCSEHDRPAMF